MGHENGGWMNEDRRDSVRPAKPPIHGPGYTDKRALETILRWCDRQGEEPEGQCLHEIEQICRKQLGLELLKVSNPPSQEQITAMEIKAND